MILFKKIIIFIAIIVIALIGFKLRTKSFAVVPFPGESLDEYSNAWVGLSLIELGVPVGESGLGGYTNVEQKYINVDHIYQGTAQGNSLPMSYPWFDHPPMMGLLVGGFSYVSGARVFEDTIAATIRKPVILLSIVTIVLTAYLSFLIFGWPTALITTVIMATSPLMVINSRMVQAENGFVPILLLCMILLWYYIKKPNIWLLSVVAFLSGLAMLFKLSAITIPITCFIVLAANSKNNWKVKAQELLIFSIIAGSIAGLFMVYGAALDFKSFLHLLGSNSNRVYGIGLNAISDLITQTKVTGFKFLSDGWPIVGWFGLLIMLIKEKEKTLLIWLPVVVYLAVYLFFGSEPYGWYRIPFLPFLIISATWMVTLFINEIKLTIISLISILIPLGVNLEKYIEIYKVDQLARYWRLGVPLLIILAVLPGFFPNKWVRTTVYLTMIMLIGAAIYTNWLRTEMMTVDYWYKVN